MALNNKKEVANYFQSDLDKNKTEIKKLLLEEIIKRYSYHEGLNEYKLKNNIEIQKAKTILNNNFLKKWKLFVKPIDDV